MDLKDRKELLANAIEALAQASKAQSRKLQVVVELFRQASTKPFRAQLV